jgi:thioredoxin 1
VRLATVKATGGWGATALGALALALGVFASSGCAPDKPAVSAPVAGDVVQQALSAGKPTVAEFGANACAACREMKPILEALRRDHGGRISVVDVDLIAQKHMGYLQRYRIQLMPTQVFFDAQGRETSRHMGKISADEILARLEGGAR